MSYFEIFLLAVGLCFDTLAVSFVQGAQNDALSLSQRLRIELTFGITQGLFIFAGWFLGFSFLKYIESIDHWIAFFLLLFIGIRMIIEGLKQKEEVKGFDLTSVKYCILGAVATSIDALAVGVSIAMTQGFGWSKIAVAALIVAAVTSATAALGLKGGDLLSKYFGNKSSVIGGVILISIGIKILVEHLTV
ncbi:MAG: manganese efflux pump [Bacteroidales bacterium]|nr:manganese efflux pump [Bacteroidales bacterium]